MVPNFLSGKSNYSSFLPSFTVSFRVVSTSTIRHLREAGRALGEYQREWHNVVVFCFVFLLFELLLTL